MTPQTTDLRAGLARVVQNVPGVAFLAPGIRQRLRSRLPRPGDDISGVTISRPDSNGALTIGIRIVCTTDRRTLDTARAVRTAVGRHLDTAHADSTARVLITVTGMV
ncbi:hypothetical protein [Streptomyces microflavus]|uniref:hypothetical protein n=1 Tax=Streptomyces microflavus TaxID=1919 RepID=UPI0036644103